MVWDGESRINFSSGQRRVTHPHMLATCYCFPRRRHPPRGQRGGTWIPNPMQRLALRRSSLACCKVRVRFACVCASWGTATTHAAAGERRTRERRTTSIGWCRVPRDRLAQSRLVSLQQTLDTDRCGCCSIESSSGALDVLFLLPESCVPSSG